MAKRTVKGCPLRGRSRWAVWLAEQQPAVAGLVALGLLLMVLSALRSRPRVRFERLPAEPVDYRLDINRASGAELMILPGISEIRARRIVQWRRRHGPFRALEDLEAIHGIGPKLARQIAPWIAFSQPPPPDRGAAGQ